jgi:hypothetical protein
MQRLLSLTTLWLGLTLAVTAIAVGSIYLFIGGICTMALGTYLAGEA